MKTRDEGLLAEMPEKSAELAKPSASVTRFSRVRHLPPYTNVDRVAVRLWVGGRPPRSLKGSRFGLHVLCALEDQIPRGIPTVYCPLDDIEDEMDVDSRRDVVLAAREVNKARRQGVEVLVTCQAGVNRSALVAAVALIQTGVHPVVALKKIRERRHPKIGMVPLSNRRFVRLLLDGFFT